MLARRGGNVYTDPVLLHAAPALEALPGLGGDGTVHPGELGRCKTHGGTPSRTCAGGMEWLVLGLTGARERAVAAWHVQPPISSPKRIALPAARSDHRAPD